MNGTIPNNVTSDDSLIFYAGSGKGAYSQAIFQSSDNWECSFDVLCKISSNFGLNFGIQSENSNKINYGVLSFESREYYSAIKWNLMCSKNTSTDGTQYNHTNLSDLTTHHVVFKRTGTQTVECYVDGTLYQTFTNYEWLSDNIKLVIYSWWGNGSEYQQITNFKVKLL